MLERKLARSLKIWLAILCEEQFSMCSKFWMSLISFWVWSCVGSNVSVR